MGMVHRTISFRDIDQEDVTQDWYFSLDESDAVDMEIVHRPDVEQYMTSIIKNHESLPLVDVFKQILFASVGKKVGKLFVKDEETVREFKYGGAFRQLFAEILEMDDAGAEFFAKIMPSSVIEKAKEEANKTYTEEELLTMPEEKFIEIAGKDEKDWSREHLLIAMRRRVAKAA